jgi:hypothetical protein
MTSVWALNTMSLSLPFESSNSPRPSSNTSPYAVSLTARYSLLERIDRRGSGEALDLDGDPDRPLLGADEPLRAEVGIDVLLPPAQTKRVVGDRPAVAHERLANVLMNVVSSRHPRPKLPGSRAIGKRTCPCAAWSSPPMKRDDGAGTFVCL